MLLYGINPCQPDGRPFFLVFDNPPVGQSHLKKWLTNNKSIQNSTIETLFKGSAIMNTLPH